jgi:scyllo-inositol 2-dehydrogenase (NADP+)
MVRVGLIGFGLAGRAFHAPIIRGVPGMELVCIVERSGSQAQQRYPDVRVVRTLEELLADRQIQVCVVATPNPTHFDLARQCLLEERHVVVDKPLVTTLGEAEELIQLAKQQKRLLTVYQNRRWDGDFQTVKKLVESGVLGRMAEYEARYDRFRPNPKPNAWGERAQPGSGLLFDLGPHLIDQALLLFGAPLAITASAFRQREWSVVEDAFDVCLEYSWWRAMLRSRTIAYAPGPHFVIHGTQGSFEKYGMDPQEEPLRKGQAPEGFDWGPHWGQDPERQWGTLSLTVGDSAQKVKTERGDYRGFYANLRDAVTQGAALAVTPEQALDTMRAIQLAYRSSRERRTVAWNEGADERQDDLPAR